MHGQKRDCLLNILGDNYSVVLVLVLTFV